MGTGAQETKTVPAPAAALLPPALPPCALIAEDEATGMATVSSAKQKIATRPPPPAAPLLSLLYARTVGSPPLAVMAPCIAVTDPARIYTEPPAPEPDPHVPQLQPCGCPPTAPLAEMTPDDATLSAPATTM